ncbi:TonB-dependent receptor plug domain-containing protein [Chelativorans salis]|uniref:TonB-dependent receptor n=1 Tax=Chelativorans salis TaxID=2978478 RepID=A0ABT2LK53_9HYPH|nr:TonB-dependent receptor [Chelativorans sp. EGI FJ00035]MCT7374940.1 TonB-dependent receptor [Chelativorans sp. EGI FJ00035]
MIASLNKSFFLITVSAISLAFAAGQPAAAQDLELGEIVITPNRTPMELSTTGSSVTRIDREEIEEQAQPLVTDYLNQVPGVSITSPGPGSETSLAIRGAPRRYVKTLYNGIDISDPTNTQVQTSYQYLLSSGIDSIEVLRGSQSTLYGSDAIAGVISMSTLGDIDPGVTHLLAGEGGSHGTARASYGLRAAAGGSRLSFNATGFHTDGISAADAGAERDGYENVTLDVAGEHEFSDMFSVFGSALFIDAEAEFDNGFVTPPVDDLFNKNLSRQLAGRAGFNLDLMDGRFRNTFSVQAFDLERTISTEFGDTVFEGKRYKADYQGAFDVNEQLTVQAGADYESQEAFFPGSPEFSPDVTEDFSITGIWGQLTAAPIENFTVTAGIRHDQHSEFGGYTTYRATGSYLFADSRTRIHSSVGTGFRAPSLYEMFGDTVSNPNLEPETSFSFDLGVEQTLLGGNLIADVTYFHLTVDDMIDCYPVGAWPCQYQRIEGTSKSRGVETSLAYRINSQLSLGGSYTYTHAEDQNGTRLPRIPRHAVGLTAAYKPAEKWTVSAAGKIAVDTVDTDGASLDDYVLLNAKIAYKPTEDTELYVRAENILDQEYQTARGFGTPDFSVFAGFKAKFGP